MELKNAVLLLFFLFFCGGCIKKEKLPKNKNADNFL